MATRWPPRHPERLQYDGLQMSGVGPMFGQVGFFVKFDGRHIEDDLAETRRLLGELEGVLAEWPWIAGDDYTIADIATFPAI